jgi:hypothetical protein
MLKNTRTKEVQIFKRITTQTATCDGEQDGHPKKFEKMIAIGLHRIWI